MVENEIDHMYDDNIHDMICCMLKLLYVEIIVC